YVRFHVAAGAAVRVSSHPNAGVVEIGRVGFICGDDGLLLNEAARREEDVSNGAAEDSHFQAIEGELHAVAGAAGARRLQSEIAHEAARAFGMAWRKIEECI